MRVEIWKIKFVIILINSKLLSVQPDYGRQTPRQKGHSRHS